LFLVAGGLFFYGKTVEGKNVLNNQAVINKYNQLKNLNRELVNKSVLDQTEILANLANKDMEEVKKRAAQTTARPLLNPDIFPEPRGQNPLIKFQKFARAYCRHVDLLILKLAAGVPPSPIEERRFREKILKRSVSSAISGNYSSFGTNTLRSGLASQGPRSDEQIEIDEFRKQRAQNISIYANTSSFFAYDFWANPQPDEKNALLHDAWFSQLAYWIQEDTILAIKKINADSKSVSTSPIKRLIEISFSGIPVGTSGTIDRSYSYGSGSAAAARLAGVNINLGAARRTIGNELFLPEYLLPPDSAPGMSMSGNVKNVGQITDSWTQRISGDLIDVIQFELGLVIDTIKIDDFIDALQSEKSTVISLNDSTNSNQCRRNQITVLQFMIEPLEVELENQSGFFYGPGSLAVLRLIGEYVFFKSGYQANMPKPVKDMLSLPDKIADPSAAYY
ncbi:MAG: hypothetical protein IID32_07285, partial [Planctomycetes bacterium]|nr:hypothetical protein [Planctomycetota bacterium]